MSCDTGAGEILWNTEGSTGREMIRQFGGRRTEEWKKEINRTNYRRIKRSTYLCDIGGSSGIDQQTLIVYVQQERTVGRQ